MKLCIMIAADSDGDRLLTRLTEERFPATRVASTGGFLRRGSVTILSAIEDAEVGRLSALLHREFAALQATVPTQAIPGWPEDAEADQFVEVRAGGVTLMVLVLDRFEQT
jgi:uncharacterized protein YaaQ